MRQAATMDLKFVWESQLPRHDPLGPVHGCTTRTISVPAAAVTSSSLPTNSRQATYRMVMTEERRYRNMKEFYPHYKDEHSKTGTRVLHLVGTSLFISQVAAAAHNRDARLILSGIVSAYGCAWIGHFFVEKNKPATFKYPFLSLISDFKMYFNILTGQETIVGS